MKKEIAEQWVRELRSRKFRQGVGALRTLGGHYCCLGVLCEMAVREGVLSGPAPGACSFCFDGETALLPESVRVWAGMSSNNGEYGECCLTRQNDDWIPFAEIATNIENNWELL